MNRERKRRAERPEGQHSAREARHTDFAIRLLDFAAWAKIPLQEQKQRLYLHITPGKLYKLGLLLHDMICSLLSRPFSILSLLPFRG